jgi:YgiT-type zinc finger domain-containing protein
MNENEKTRPCPSCDGAMQYGEQEETLTYQGNTLIYMQPGWYCAACDNGILEDADNEVHDAALHELIAHVRSHARAEKFRPVGAEMSGLFSPTSPPESDSARQVGLSGAGITLA